MTTYSVVLLCFLTAFTLHILLYRRVRVTIVGVIFVYALGTLLLCVFGKIGLIALPWSSVFLYILLSAAAVLFYFATSLGTEIPTSIILKSFKRKKMQTIEELIALFTDKGLIFDRIDDLIQSKMVKRQEQKLKLTWRGNIIWRVLETYRWIFHRTVTE